MIASLIFFIHLLFALIVFTKKWQEENLTSGFLNVGLVGILFGVGWSLSNIAAKFLLEPEGFGIYFDRDTFSLVLLTIGEYFFYRMYYKDTFIPTAAGMETQ
jgi:formate hydrogenlyase subunit 3/multisubunit Na+/H+ antiporter MnhD subunit